MSISNYDMEDESSKYLKKRNADVSKSRRKADHKHQYKPCLLKSDDEYLGELFQGSSYCTICGKIGDVAIENAVFENGYWRSLTNEELKLKYKDYETITVESFFQKYVGVTKGVGKSVFQLEE